MVPGVRRPASDVTWRGRLHPLIGVICWGSFVCGVVPCARPSITLKSEDHGLAIWHHLAQIDLEIRDSGRRAGDVNPSVKDEILRRLIVAKDHSVALAAIVRVTGRK